MTAERTGRALAFALLAAIPLQRLFLALCQPDLLHDLDMGELKHLDLALYGLPGGEGFADRWRTFVGGPENIHHGGFPAVSGLTWAMSRVFDVSLFLLRLIPIAATTLAALCMALLLHRRAGVRAAWVGLALFVGAPPLLLKWTTTSRGGHLEGILFPMLVALLLDRALRGGWGRWLAAGIVGGFSVYFTYLAAPAVVLLSVGALVERGLCDRKAAAVGAGALIVGGLIGFAPWLFGLLVLDLPYLEASIHQTSNPNEAVEVYARTLGGTVAALRDGLAHNLWPWAVHSSTEAAYRSATPDILVFQPTAATWALRGLVTAAILSGVGWAAHRRSPLLVALCLLPAAHHLFVLRTANTVGYPDIPHRYLVLVFPAIAAAAGLGASWKRAGPAVAAGVVCVAAAGLISQSAFWGPPRWDQFESWPVASFREAGLGQVRVGEDVAPLLDQTGETANEYRRGVALIYPAISDYYLLFREEPDERPYPDQLFRESDPLSQNDAQRAAVVQGALAATRARATDAGDLTRWLCSWQPHPEHAAPVAAAWADAGVSCAP
jgi:hypothetical protein